MRLDMSIPRLRLWHLMGLVAAGAAFLATFELRWKTEDPTYRAIRMLRSSDAAERVDAARHLSSLRAPDPRAIGPLAEALFDLDPAVRAAAADSIGSTVEFKKDDPEAPAIIVALIRGLADPDPVARRSMILNLARFEADPKLVVPPLLELARSGDPEARRQPFELLGFQYARRDEAARAFLFAALADPNPEVRVLAIDPLWWSATLPGLAPEPYRGEVREALAGRAGDESPKVRGRAIGQLARLATESGVEDPRVVEALADPDPGVRAVVASNLAWQKPKARASAALVAALGRLLDDADPRVRLSSAGTLGWLKLDATPTLPGLRKLADDPEPEVRKAAATAIGFILGASGSLRSTIAGLDEPEAGARAYAASQAGQLGPAAGRAVPRLIQLLADPDVGVRRASAEALGSLGPAAVPALPALLERAEGDEDKGVRAAAAGSAKSLREAGAGTDAPP